MKITYVLQESFDSQIGSHLDFIRSVRIDHILAFTILANFDDDIEHKTQVSQEAGGVVDEDFGRHHHDDDEISLGELRIAGLTVEPVVTAGLRVATLIAIAVSVMSLTIGFVVGMTTFYGFAIKTIV